MIKIGICDDDVRQTKILSYYLQKLNIEDLYIISETNCITFLEKINKLKPDIIFLDIEMNEMDGIELGKEIRKRN